MDIQDVTNLFSRIDFPTLIPIGFMFWFFKSYLDKKFDKIDQRFEKIDQRFEKVDEQIRELRTSINRMEGAFYSKECCMLKQDDSSGNLDNRN